MTKVDFFKNGDGRFYRVLVRGHADSAPHGKDLVCAAVSTLTITLVNAMHEIVGIQREFYTDKERAVIDIHLQESELGEQTDLLIRSFHVGMKSIHEIASDFVEINVGG